MKTLQIHQKNLPDPFQNLTRFSKAVRSCPDVSRSTASSQQPSHQAAASNLPAATSHQPGISYQPASQPPSTRQQPASSQQPNPQSSIPNAQSSIPNPESTIPNGARRHQPPARHPASQVPARCQPDASQVPAKYQPGASQISPAASQP